MAYNTDNNTYNDTFSYVSRADEFKALSAAWQSPNNNNWQSPPYWTPNTAGGYVALPPAYLDEPANARTNAITQAAAVISTIKPFLKLSNSNQLLTLQSSLETYELEVDLLFALVIRYLSLIRNTPATKDNIYFTFSSRPIYVEDGGGTGQYLNLSISDPIKTSLTIIRSLLAGKLALTISEENGKVFGPADDKTIEIKPMKRKRLKI